MGAPGKQGLTEQDIRSQFISPAVMGAGWDQRLQIREEVSLTAGRVIVRGKLHSRGHRRAPGGLCGIVVRTYGYGRVICRTITTGAQPL